MVRSSLKLTYCLQQDGGNFISSQSQGDRIFQSGQTLPACLPALPASLKTSPICPWRKHWKEGSGVSLEGRTCWTKLGWNATLFSYSPWLHHHEVHGQIVLQVGTTSFQRYPPLCSLRIVMFLVVINPLVCHAIKTSLGLEGKQNVKCKETGVYFVPGQMEKWRENQLCYTAHSALGTALGESVEEWHVTNFRQI